MSIISILVDEIGLDEVIPDALEERLNNTASGISSPPESDVDPEDVDLDEIIESAQDRASMYNNYTSLFSQDDNVERIANNVIDPINGLLEATGITDRYDGGPPPAAAAVDIAPLPAPISAMSNASDVLTSATLVGANRILDCGAYTEVLDQCLVDSSDSSASNVRSLNETLSGRALNVATTANDVDLTEPDPFAELLDALKNEKQETAPLSNLAPWTEIEQSPYDNIAEVTDDSREYIINIAKANASAIVGARQELTETIDKIEGTTDGTGCLEPNVTTRSVEGQAAGGPVILMGLDSELVPGDSNHGPPEEHADMVASILDSVTNGGDGILALGGNPSSNSDIIDYWEEDVGNDPMVDEDVTFVNGAEDIRNVDFDGYAMIGVISSTGQINSGLTNSENDALIDRQGDIAAFVNSGGGFLGKTQDGMSDPWDYISPLVDIEPRSANNSSITVTDDGKDLGLSQSGMDGWCCYHESFEEDSVPDFLNVLLRNPDQADDPPAAIGGDAVIIETAVELEIFGPENVEAGEPTDFEVSLTNLSDEAGGEVLIGASFARSGGIQEGDVEIDDNGGLELDEENGILSAVYPEEPFEITEDFDDSETLSVTFNSEDLYTVEVAVVGEELGDTFAQIEFQVQAVGEDPGICD